MHTTFFCLTFDLNQSLYILRLEKDGLKINLSVSWLATLETSHKAFSFFTIPNVHTFYLICRLRVRPNTCSFVKVHCHIQCLLAFPTLCCIFKELILVWSNNVSTSKMHQNSENILGNGKWQLVVLVISFFWMCLLHWQIYIQNPSWNLESEVLFWVEKFLSKMHDSMDIMDSMTENASAIAMWELNCIYWKGWVLTVRQNILFGRRASLGSN